MKILVMNFATETSKKVSLKIPNVKDSVTADQVKALGADIITKNVFDTSGGRLKKLLTAKITETTTTDVLS